MEHDLLHDALGFTERTLRVALGHGVHVHLLVLLVGHGRDRGEVVALLMPGDVLHVVIEVDPHPSAVFIVLVLRSQEIPLQQMAVFNLIRRPRLFDNNFALVTDSLGRELAIYDENLPLVRNRQQAGLGILGPVNPVVDPLEHEPLQHASGRNFPHKNVAALVAGGHQLASVQHSHAAHPAFVALLL